MINKRKLGKTDLLVSEIGLGGYQLGGLSRIEQRKSSNHSLKSPGCNLIPDMLFFLQARFF